MHARHTNPTTGRFLSVDPMGANPGMPQTWNRYSYVTGNPLKYVDPQGLAEVDACNDNTSCVGSITVIDKGPANSDPLTGLNDLIAGRADLDNLAAGDPEFGTQVLRRAGALAEGPVNAETTFLKYLALFAPGFGEAEAVSLGFVDTGAINVFNRYLGHVVNRHTILGTETAGKSIFGATENVVTLIKGAEGTAPMGVQWNGNLVFVVDAGRIIGTEGATGAPTAIYTVITDGARNFVTAFPGLPWR